MAGPEVHEPPMHRSPTVQAFPSSHGAALLVNTHAPVAGSQASSVQALPSLHGLVLPERQVPALQESPTVHASPSSQADWLGTDTQSPVSGSHESSVHAFPSSQSTRSPLSQLPAAQRSPTVHASPSSHGSEFGENEQRPVVPMQVSVVHALPS